MAEEHVYGYNPTVGVDGDSVRISHFDSSTCTGWGDPIKAQPTDGCSSRLFTTAATCPFPLPPSPSRCPSRRAAHRRRHTWCIPDQRRCTATTTMTTVRRTYQFPTLIPKLRSRHVARTCLVKWRVNR